MNALIAEQRTPHATYNYVNRDTSWDEEASLDFECYSILQDGDKSRISYSDSAHARQISDCSGTTKNEHRRYDDVCRKSGIRGKLFCHAFERNRDEPKEHKDTMCQCTPASTDDLKPCVRIWRVELELGCELCE